MHAGDLTYDALAAAIGETPAAELARRPAELIQGRADWLWFVHPSRPRAMEEAIIFFNRMASGPLR